MLSCYDFMMLLCFHIIMLGNCISNLNYTKENASNQLSRESLCNESLILMRNVNK